MEENILSRDRCQQKTLSLQERLNLGNTCPAKKAMERLFRDRLRDRGREKGPARIGLVKMADPHHRFPNPTLLDVLHDTPDTASPLHDTDLVTLTCFDKPQGAQRGA
jgi:hypothetical protein